MKKSSVLSTLFGFALLAGLAYALWYVARLGAGLVGGLDRQTTIPAAAALTVLLAAWIVSSGLHAIARRHDTAQRRAARSAAYEAFLQLRAGAIEGVVAMRGNVIPVDESAADAPILIHASPAVLGAYARLRRAEASGAAPRGEMVALIHAMRRDLGQSAPEASAADVAEILSLPEREPVS